MAISAKMITFDCENPQRLSGWWATALSTDVVEDYGDFVMIPNEPIVLGFQRVPETKQVKNRLHLDFHTEDQAAEAARLIGLGAISVGEHSMPGLSWTTLQDPEGNEFDVAEYVAE